MPLVAEAVAVIANMADSALAGSDEGHREDHGRPPLSDRSRLHPPVEPRPGAQQHRVDRSPIWDGRRSGPPRVGTLEGGGDRCRPRPLRPLGGRPERVQGPREPGLSRRGRRHLRPRGLPPGSFVGGPVPALGTGPSHRHLGRRLRRHLRPGELQRPPPPRSPARCPKPSCTSSPAG